jgi:hypothetical protein
VSLFKRRKADDDADGDDVTSELTAPDDLDDTADHAGDADDGADADEEALDAGASTPAATFERSGGPFDRDEVDGPDGRLELGALWVPMVEGMELQLQMDEGTGQVTGVFVVLGDSAVQLQAFAAPRSEGIWRDVREEIAAGITEQGGTADPGYGRFGGELLARVPAPQPDGKVGFQPLRFTGVDGPRWLLRAVFHGRAAVEPESATALEDLVARVVVDRGREPMGPRELLPLHLPVGAEVSGEPGEDDDPDLGPQERIAENAPPQTVDDLQPFKRGPEITERR